MMKIPVIFVLIVALVAGQSVEPPSNEKVVEPVTAHVVVENATESVTAPSVTVADPPAANDDTKTKSEIKPTEMWYQVYQEPLIVEIDRSTCSNDAKQSCLCYGISEEFSDKPIDSKAVSVCGRGFGLICSNVKYSGRLHVFLEGELASYSTAQHVSIPSFEVVGQAVGETKHVGHLILLKSSDDCAKITINNILANPRDIVPNDKQCPCRCKAKPVKDEF